jgi:hypothetical protein
MTEHVMHDNRLYEVEDISPVGDEYLVSELWDLLPDGGLIGDISVSGGSIIRMNASNAPIEALLWWLNSASGIQTL